MNGFDQYAREHRRLEILSLLSESAGYQVNHLVLREALGGRGYPASLDAVAGDLNWLAEQGLVQVQQIEDIRIATLTSRGQDAAAGRAVVPGVARPLPGA